MSDIKEFLEGNINLFEQEEPPESEMIEIANEFVKVLRQATGKSLDDIKNDLPDFAPFEFNFDREELTSGGWSVYDDEEVEEQARNAFDDDLEKIKDVVFSELSGNMIDEAKVEDSINPVSITFDWDFTEHTVSGEPGDWEVVY